MNCLYNSLEYIRKNQIDGDYVECGVYKGGNILGILKYLEHHNLTADVWAYDTFAGMTAPEDIDVDYNGSLAINILDEVMCLSPLEEFIETISSSNYPKEKVKIVVGDICQTLLDVGNIPDRIALLRLDTDWYASTKIELEVLWEKLVPGGIMIIDDYGHWQGCKKAVDEFFDGKNQKFYQIDYTGILTFK